MEIYIERSNLENQLKILENGIRIKEEKIEDEKELLALMYVARTEILSKLAFDCDPIKLSTVQDDVKML